ncbi:MAG TPA: aminotransferase class III-fold pyridoxal phosphate-dependent enzyme, partial [Gemmataceae bacterium]|nr:aminotransferase class III-fold pyridoxal phosphate-dependent enzyme [Gemmataceae bacterium]
FVRGEGRELIDADGRRYLDAVAAYGALPFGFNPPAIWRSLLDVRRAGEPSFVQPSLSDAAGELAEELLAVAPANLRYVTFTNSGAESVEAAIKMCRAATGRPGILSTDHSFHGKTLGALSATGNPDYGQAFGAPVADFGRIPFGDAEALRRELDERPGYYAAFVVEPIQGEGGVVVPPPGYLPAVRDICTKAGVLLVLDEVQTGLGRTGSMFACKAEDVEPDVMTLAKALGGGLIPIGAVLASKAAYTETFALKHSSTFAGNALACRAGLAALRLLTRDDRRLVRRVRRNGARLAAGLRKLQRQYPQLIAEVRGRGFLLGIRFHVERDLWPESLLGVAAEQEFFTPLFASYMLNVEGVRVAPTLNGKAVIRIEPALTMKWRECERVLEAVERTLAAFASGDTGAVVASILAGRSRRSTIPANAPPKSWVGVRPRENERRFAFLLHPLDLKSIVDFDPSLATLSGEALEQVSQNFSSILKPFVLSRGRVKSATGVTAYGEFITLPWTAAQLAGMRRKDAMEHVRGAVRLAKSRGAQMVGLGAFTSVATLAGQAVADEGVAITTGNSFTAVASVAAMNKALALVGPRREPVTAAVVGATGAIGRAMAQLLAEQVGTLLLVGNPDSAEDVVRERLLKVVADISEFVAARQAEGATFARGTFAEELLALPQSLDRDGAVARLERSGRLVLSRDPKAAARQAHAVVTATSATGTVIGPGDLRPHAVVCDVSRPANVSRECMAARPDVLVIDGGVIAVPDGSALGQFGMGEGLVYACMAETMMLTLAGHLQHTSLGADLSSQTLRQLRSLADQHGFRVAKLRSFGRPLEDALHVTRRGA